MLIRIKKNLNFEFFLLKQQFLFPLNTVPIASMVLGKTQFIGVQFRLKMSSKIFVPYMIIVAILDAVSQ